MRDATTPPRPPSEPPLAPLAVRCGLGGLLMGLANLVPGISGGTMLLAAGVYPRFIDAVAELSTLRIRRVSIVVLGCIATAAALAIVLLAGTIQGLVVDQRWVMYSLFVGLTLGGVPLVWQMAPDRGLRFWAGAVAGLGAMVLLAFSQIQGAGAGGEAESGVVLFLLAGVAGASAMVLPGVSGGYLWLVLGVYVPILGAIDACRQALGTRALETLWDPILEVIAPVGLGVVIGVVAVSNALSWTLQRYPRPTLGFLLGLLLGAVVGLWPFQHGVPPSPGSTLKGQTVVRTATGLVLEPSGKSLAPEDYPTAYFTPQPATIAAALGLAVAGFAGTLGISHIGRPRGGEGPAGRATASPG